MTIVSAICRFRSDHRSTASGDRRVGAPRPTVACRLVMLVDLADTLHPEKPPTYANAFYDRIEFR